jgi:hypothetical protein
MAYTSEDLRKDKEDYKAWAKPRDREQFLEYVEWLRNNRGHLKRSREHESR